MFFNKLTYPLVLAVLLVAGFVFLAIPATAEVVPRLEVVDELEDVEGVGNENTQGIQVYGIRAESVSFELTVTFQDTASNPANANTPVTGFGDDDEDIVLFAADSDDRIIENGATSSRIQRNTDGSVYTTTITARGNVTKVFIQVPDMAARTPTTIRSGVPTRGVDTRVADSVDLHNTLTGTDPNRVQLVVNIIRSAAPPLEISPDRSIGGKDAFTVTLTSTTPITLTRADIDVTGGFIPADGLSADPTKRVWTVTIVPGVVNVQKITVQQSANGSYIFPKGTFTIDTTGPVATITGTPPVGGGVFPVTITFDEPLQLGASLIPSEITVIGGSIAALFAIPNTNSYVATLTPNPSATTVTVQVNANAVADAGGVPNAATPSPAHSFTVAATATPTPPSTTPGRGSANVTISEIMFASDGGPNDIQWIELFNISKTQTVALDTNGGWELIIENYDDPRSTVEPLSGSINFKDSGSVKIIKPRQTVLIVSANGRNSDRTHFTTTRVFRVFPALADEFGMINREDPFLHPTEGFHIQLVDGNGNLVDEIGNLDGRTRTWELPYGRTGDGSRTSLIRRYREYNPRTRTYTNKGTALDGTLREAWISAAETEFRDLSRRDIETWYGGRTDYGSPRCQRRGATTRPTFAIPSRTYRNRYSRHPVDDRVGGR